MKVTNKLAALAVTALLVSPAYAYEIIGTLETPAATNSAGKSLTGITEKNVSIVTVKLSDKELRTLALRQPRVAYQASRDQTKLPSSIQIGMNGVPVLDQGRHGSCVTFAETAALDAVLGKGDYISQLCSLELGAHLARHGYIKSGWDGTLGPQVLEQIARFGIVSKQTQAAQSCADVYEYPIKDKNNIGNEMSIAEYHAKSEDINPTVYWKHLLSHDQVFKWHAESPEKMRRVLQRVKQALVKGHRVTAESFLMMTKSCRAGACGSFHSANDSWVLSSNLETEPYTIGDHEMVVTGYDDNATVFDHQGGKHQGLLTLRNSWGTEVGDHGNYYMSYDYFMKYAHGAQEIIKVEPK